MRAGTPSTVQVMQREAGGGDGTSSRLATAISRARNQFSANSTVSGSALTAGAVTEAGGAVRWRNTEMDAAAVVAIAATMAVTATTAKTRRWSKERDLEDNTAAP